MKTSNNLVAVVAETSVIVRNGIVATLKRIPGARFSVIELATPDALRDCLRMQHVDVLLVNPHFGGFFDVEALRAAFPSHRLKVVAITLSVLEPSALLPYDECISIVDDIDTIASKLTRLQKHPAADEPSDGADLLSQREREIVTAVVRGLTNKEIADRLFISVHTVITHRRNISKKLQIHSASGLTIYAIVNKLVALEDIRSL